MSLPNIVFSKWTRWADRITLDGIETPGVYLLAHLKMLSSERADPQAREVIYIGEACDQTLKARWNNFHSAAFRGKKNTHSGGETYRELFDGTGDKLFVAAFPVVELKDPLRSLFIRYVERKLILEYALR